MPGPKTGLKPPSEMGKLPIVTYVGNQPKLIENSFRGKKTGDYQEETDGTRFARSFDTALERLPKDSVLEMDILF